MNKIFTKKYIMDIKKELHNFKKKSKELAFSNQIDENMLNEQLLKVFNVLSKIDDTKNNFKDLYLEVAKFGILMFRYKNTIHLGTDDDINNYFKYYDLLDEELLYTDKELVKWSFSHKSIIFKENKNFNEFSNNFIDTFSKIPFCAREMLKNNSLSNRVKFFNTLWDYSVYLTGYLVISEYCLNNEISKHYNQLKEKTNNALQKTNNYNSNNNNDKIKFEVIK